MMKHHAQNIHIRIKTEQGSREIRDSNAAKNLVKLATQNHWGSQASGDSNLSMGRLESSKEEATCVV